jgi:hypothetical protein
MFRATHSHLTLPSRADKDRQPPIARVAVAAAIWRARPRDRELSFVELTSQLVGRSVQCLVKSGGMNRLYFGDNLRWLSDRKEFPDASVDLVYLDPPFNSNADYNVLFREPSGQVSQFDRVRNVPDHRHIELNCFLLLKVLEPDIQEN